MTFTTLIGRPCLRLGPEAIIEWLMISICNNSLNFLKRVLQTIGKYMFIRDYDLWLGIFVRGIQENPVENSRKGGQR